MLSQSAFAPLMQDLYPVEVCLNLISETIRLLRRMPAPPDPTPGPYTANHSLRRIKHLVFKEQTTEVVYNNIDELEQHINRVSTSLCNPEACSSLAMAWPRR